MWCRGEEFREEGGWLFCHPSYFQRKGGLDLPTYRESYLFSI